MVFSMLPVQAFATQQHEDLPTEGLCEHHTAHTESCGYAADQPCGYVCGECGAAEETQAAEETEAVLESEAAAETEAAEVPAAEPEEFLPEQTEAPAPQPVSVQEEYIPGGDPEEAALALEAYLQMAFYGRGSVSFFGTAAYDELNAYAQCLYNGLKTAVTKIASGERASTVITVNVSSMNTSASSLSQITPLFTVSTVLDALLHDCPYELYWYDKTSATSISYSGSSCGNGMVSLSSITITMPVTQDLRGSGYTSSAPVADVSGVNAAAAAEAAQQIVNSCAGQSAYEKLNTFKTAICDLVDYNYDALGSSFSADADPWQLLWVFDGDPDTKVVCEGYSKAFQYLCDLDGTIDCYTVSGVMATSSGSGGHMWNTVTLDGQNYLVDVTNSDSGTVGRDGSLFLAGASGSPDSSYTFTNSNGYGIAYAYDSDTLSLWGNAGILTLAQSNYEPGEDPVDPEPEGSATARFAMAVAEAQANGASWYYLTEDIVLDASLMLEQSIAIYTDDYSITIPEGKELILNGTGALAVRYNSSLNVEGTLTVNHPQGLMITGGTLNVGSNAVVNGAPENMELFLHSADAQANGIHPSRLTGTYYVNSGTAQSLKTALELCSGYGRSMIAVPQSITVEDGYLLTIPETMTLVLSSFADPVVLSVYDLENSGKILIGGNCSLVVRSGGSLTNNATGEITVDGTLVCDGSYTNNGTVTGENVPVPPAVTFGTCGDDLYWEFDAESGCLSVSGTGQMYDYDEQAAPWVHLADDILAVDVFWDVTSVGAGAFANLPNMADLWLPTTVKTIGDSAFAGASSLSWFFIPDDMTSIGNSAFAGCGASLIQFSGSMPQTIADNAFAGVTARMRYPYYEESFTAETMLQYGGQLTWTAYELPYGVCGTEEENYENVTWSLDRETGVLTISGTGAMNDTYDVTVPGWGSHYRTEIIQVVVEEGVTTVGNSAFATLDNLTTVVLSEGVREIGAGAFGWNERLTNVELPSTIEVVESQAFAGCTLLKRITFKGDNMPAFADDCFADTKLTVSYPVGWGDASAMPSLGGDLTWEAYNDNVGSCGENLTWSFSAEDGVLTISGTGEMYDYDAQTAPWTRLADQIVRVVVRYGVASVGAQAFANLPNLEYFQIPGSIKSIGAQALSGCSKLSRINIPKDMTFIGENAFAGTSVSEVYFIGSIPESIAENVFEGVTAQVRYPYYDDSFTASNMVDYGGQLTWIPYGLPYGECGIDGDNLTWNLDRETGVLTISGTGAMYDNYLIEVSNWAAYYTQEVKSVVVEAGVTTIGRGAFEGLQNLESVSIADTVVSIGNGAFQDCSKLASVELPASIERVDTYAFNRCAGLLKVTFAGDAPVFGDLTFHEVTATVYIPEGNDTWTAEVQQNYGGTLTWETYTPEDPYSGACGENLTWRFDPDSGVLTVSGTGEMADYHDGVQPWHAYLDQILYAEVEEGVASIGACAFAGCTSMLGLKLPATLTSIFENSLPENGALEWITVPEASQDYMTLDGVLFTESGNVLMKYPSGKADAEYTVPGDVWLVAIKAFADCENLRTIRFEGDAPFIESDSFRNVQATVYYSGEKSGWTEDMLQNYGGNLTWVMDDGTFRQADFAEALAAAAAAGETYVLNQEVVLTEDMTIAQGSCNVEIREGGRILVAEGAELTVHSVITVQEGGLEVALGGSLVSYSELVLKTGGELIVDGTADIRGYVFNQGCLRVSPEGTLNVREDGVVTNELLDNTDGGSLEIFGTVNLEGTLKNDSVVINEGRICLDANGKIQHGKLSFFRNDGRVFAGIGENAQEYRAEITLGGTPAVEITIPAGLSILLEGDLLPGNATGTRVVWSLSDESLASFRHVKGGVFLNAADVTEVQRIYVTAASADGLAEPDVLDVVILPKTRALTLYTVSHSNGEETRTNISRDAFQYVILNDGNRDGFPLQLTAEASPIGADSKVVWTSSNTRIASIDRQTGLAQFTGRAGTVKFTAAATDGSGTRTSVTYKILQPMDIEPVGDTHIDLVSGKSETIQVVDSSGQKINAKNLQLSIGYYDGLGDWVDTTASCSAYLTVAAGGKLTAKTVSEGVDLELSVRAVSDGVCLDEILYTVTIYPAATLVKFSVDEEMNNGQTALFDWAGQDEMVLHADVFPYGTMDVPVQWTIGDSKSAYADYSFDEENNLIISNPRKAGTVTIKAMAGDGSKKTGTIKVQLGAFADWIDIEGTSDVMHSREKLQLRATVFNQRGGREISKPGVTWSLRAEDKAYASVDANGKVTAKTVYGETEIKVIATSKDGMAVAEYPITIYPSDPGILTLWNEDENVTKGTVMLDLNSDTASVTLMAANLDGEAVAVKSWTPAKGNKNYEIIKNDDGTLTVNMLKKATVSVKVVAADGRTATTVVKGDYLTTGIEISQKKTNQKENLMVGSGKSIDLQATVTGSSCKKFAWSVAKEDAAYAKISAAGRLTATKDLVRRKTITVNVEALDGSGATASIEVTITPLVERIELFLPINNEAVVVNGQTINWAVDDAFLYQMGAWVYPMDESEEWCPNNEVEWKSSNPRILTINECDEMIFGDKTGTVTITATAKDGSGKTASVTLKVVRPVREVKFRDGNIAGGKTLNLSTLIRYITPDATNKKLQYSIVENENAADVSYGAEFVTLNANGQLKTRKVTSYKYVEIMACDEFGYVQERFLVHIYPATTRLQLTASRPVGEDLVELDAKKVIELPVGSTIWLHGHSTPGNAYWDYTWKVSDGKSAGFWAYDVNGDRTLDDDMEGPAVVLEGIKAGKTVTITATANDGSGKKATLKVKIVEAQ